MGATTLYVIVLLTNGDLRGATYFPWADNQACAEAARGMGHGAVANRYLRAGAKSVMFYCAPPVRPLVIAR